MTQIYQYICWGYLYGSQAHMCNRHKNGQTYCYCFLFQLIFSYCGHALNTMVTGTRVPAGNRSSGIKKKDCTRPTLTSGNILFRLIKLKTKLNVMCSKQFYTEQAFILQNAMCILWMIPGAQSSPVTLRGRLCCAPWTQSLSGCIFDHQFQYPWHLGILFSLA